MIDPLVRLADNFSESGSHYWHASLRDGRLGANDCTGMGDRLVDDRAPPAVDTATTAAAAPSCSSLAGFCLLDCILATVGNSNVALIDRVSVPAY